MTNEIQSLVATLTDQLSQMEKVYKPGHALIRIEQPVPMINLFSWLDQQELAQRAYWEDRESNYKVAALGRSWSFKLTRKTDVQQAFSDAVEVLPAGGRCLSYLSFSDSESMVWPAFGYGEVFLPVLEITQTRKGCFLACYLNPQTEAKWQASIKEAQSTLHQVQWQGEWAREHGYTLSGPGFWPDNKHWQTIIEKALQSFESRALSKVVLSREARFSFKGHLNPWWLLQCWQHANPRSYVFAFESTEKELFFGCSPERLYRRIDQVVHTEALAGTARRGQNRDEDFELELRLLNDAKNVHENQLVLQDIRQRLNKLCRSLEFDRSHSVVKLKTIQHLRYLIRGVIKPEVTDAELFVSLHPTPAVGGSSRKKAIHFIEANEGYPRGLYAGACGVIGHNCTEFAVSIRSALLKAETLSLFSGAGIVMGSDVNEEWLELDNKIQTITGLLGVQEQSSLGLDSQYVGQQRKVSLASSTSTPEGQSYVSSQAS